MTNRQRALLFDLISFTVLSGLSEVLLAQANTFFFSGYSYSITLVLVYILMVRWGLLGVAFGSVVGLISVTVMQGATLETFVIYGVGNLFCISAWFYLVWVRKHNFRLSGSVFVILGQAGIIFGRSLLLIVFGEDIISSFFLVLSNEMLSTIAIAMFIALLLKRKGILIDLARLYDEEEVNP